ncbi:MAG: GreA/GreB family elongation factor [Methylophilus sp.]|nr:GreA/GreB family elongation factor [Methylophilus sp.]
MSRGFVKEDDLELAGTDIPEHPVSSLPNYVTPSGLAQLQNQAEALAQEYQHLVARKEDPVISQRLAVAEREARYIEARLESAILVEPALQDKETVLFGAQVKVEDEEGNHHTFIIVGEDEANIAENKVSYVSPIAKAIIGKKVGDSAIWQRPVGNMQLEILEILY